MKKFLMLSIVFLISNSYLYGQELLPRGEVYVNDTTNVFIITPGQAQQIIYWKEDSDTLSYVRYQLTLSDSLNVLYEEKIIILEEEVEMLYDEIPKQQTSLFNIKTLRVFGGGILVGVIIGTILNSN